MASEFEAQELVQQYTTAVAEERAAWRVLHEPQLSEDQRERAYSTWMDAAARAKLLATKLKKVATASGSSQGGA